MRNSDILLLALLIGGATQPGSGAPSASFAAQKAKLLKLEQEVENRRRAADLDSRGIAHDITKDKALETRSLAELIVEITQIHHPAKPMQPAVQVARAVTRYEHNIAATAAIIETARFQDDGNGGFILDTSPTVASEFGVCATEPFAQECAAAACTAVLIGKRTIATAAHCVDGGRHLKQSFVFGYELQQPTGKARRHYSKDHIYTATQISIAYDEFWPMRDWAVVVLDREVAGVEPVERRTNGAVKKGDKLYTTGHPAGMPRQEASEGQVTDDTFYYMFMSDNDTLERSSGSPIFNRADDRLEGIFVRGEKWLSTGTCQLARVCSDEDCRGEEAMRIRCLPLVTESSTGVMIDDSPQPCQ